jgi:histidinol phosphatase-like PHP family hydrolase
MPLLIDHDVHVHTVLSSCCKDPLQTAANVVSRAAETGLRTIGFADHVWDSRIPGASRWYEPQTLDHILRIREEIPADTKGVRVLVGCETEYCGGGKAGLSRESAERLDFVLIPTSHFHMKGFTVPESLGGPKEVAALLCERFGEVLDLGLATGIAHPFVPLGFRDRVDDILPLIPDSQFLDLFGRAADLGVAIEASVVMFPSIDHGETAGWHDEALLRVLTLAKRAGCRFFFASDAHNLSEIGSVLRLAPFAERIGITEDDVLPTFRST